MADLMDCLEEMIDDDGRIAVRVCRIRRDRPDTPWAETKIVPSFVGCDRTMTRDGLRVDGPLRIECLVEMDQIPSCMRGMMSFDRLRMEIADHSVVMAWVDVSSKGIRLKTTDDVAIDGHAGVTTMDSFSERIAEDGSNGRHLMAAWLYIDGPGKPPTAIVHRGRCQSENSVGGISWFEGESPIDRDLHAKVSSKVGHKLRMEIVGHAIDVFVMNVSSDSLALKSTSPPLILTGSPSTEMVSESYARIRREAQAKANPETYMDRPPML